MPVWASARTRGERLHRFAGLAALASALAACSGPPPDGPIIEVRLSTALGCRPSRLVSARLEAWGDFPLRDEHVFEVSEGGPVLLPVLPPSTAELFVELTGDMVVRGVGRVPPAGERYALLALPEEVSCPLPDPEIRFVEGAASVVLDDQTVLLAGGLDETGAPSRRVVSLGPGAELGLLERPLFLTTAFASATRVGPRAVLIAGGRENASGGARDTFERLDLDAPPDAPPEVGTLSSRRREHAAIGLRSGETLLVGGHDGTGYLATLEIIASGSTRGVASTARLRTARASPVVFERADGSIVVAGGVGEGGAVATIELVAPDRSRVDRVALDLPPPALVLSSSGERLLWVATDGQASIVLLADEPQVVPLGLSLPRVAAATDRRGDVVLVDASTLRPELVVLDGGGALRRMPTSRTARSLVALANGTLLELDEGGASRFVVSMASELAPLPPSYQFPVDLPLVLLDAAPRFLVMAGALRAVAEGATVSLPELSFRDFAATVRLRGPAELVLFENGHRRGSVRVQPDALEGVGCEILHAPDAPIVLRRAGETISVDAGAGTGTCSIALPERVSFGVRLALGSELVSIALERL